MTFIRRKNSASGIDSQGTEAGSSPSPLNRRYANFQTERLRFSLDRVTVVPHWKNHLFFSVVLLVGGGIMLLLLMQPEREIVPVIITGIFALAGLGGMIAPYFARRPEIDLFSRSFYPRGRRSAAAFEQIPLERFRFLRILTKRARHSEGGSYRCYELNIVAGEEERYNLLTHGNYRQIRADGEKLASLLSIPLVDAEEESAAGLGGPSGRAAASKGSSGVVLVIFGSVFFAFGAVFWCLLTGPALLGCISSAGWDKVPATVVSSRLDSRRDDGSTVYAVDIRYTYQYRGRSYESNNYDFFRRAGSYSNVGVGGMRNIVASYPAGSSFQCLVNPRKPSQAAISGKLSLQAVLVIILTSVFPLVGLGIITGGVVVLCRKRR